MSKLNFRSRQVDPTKPLPIYFNNDIPDLQDYAAINRTVPQMPTGMEKDEEAEHHLQRALSAQQAFGATSSAEYAIPTPKVEIDTKMYERIYNIEYPKQKQYIRIQPFSNDYDYPDYDADFEDEEWLNDKRATLPVDFSTDLTLYFECIMDRLEKTTAHSMNLPSVEEAKLVLMRDYYDDTDCSNPNYASFPRIKHKKERDEFLICIYEYWKAKRLKYKHPLTPIILTDKSGVVTQPNNPFLVFRRRTEKMQTRKNRKNEEQSYEKMLILKRDLCKAQQILRLIKKREHLKKEFLKLTVDTFDKRFKLNDYDGSMTDSITCSLRPSMDFPDLINNLEQRKLSTKQLGTMNDKQISNLIHSNKLNKIGSPPFNKRLPQLESNENMYGDADVMKMLDKPKKLKHQLKSADGRESMLNRMDAELMSGNNKNKLLNKLSSPSSTSLLNRNQTPNNNNKLLNSSSSKNYLNNQNNKYDPNRSLSGSQLTPNMLKKHNNNNNKRDSSDLYDDLDSTDMFSGSRMPLDSGGDSEDVTVNELENLDTIVSETRNKLSTSSEKDGYWCFKRKEGCKYLLQNGSIFKNDIFNHEDPTIDSNGTVNNPHHHHHNQADQFNTSASSSTIDSYHHHQQQQHFQLSPKKFYRNKTEQKLHELQQYYYGYTITKNHRHLGLVRRRLGRGGRILMDRLDPSLFVSSNPDLLFTFNFHNYRTYYPKECFNLNTDPNEINAGADVNFLNESIANEMVVEDRNNNSISNNNNNNNQDKLLLDSTTITAATSDNNINQIKDRTAAVVPASNANYRTRNKRPKLRFRSSFEDLVENLNELSENDDDYEDECNLADCVIDPTLANTNSYNANNANGLESALVYDHNLFSIYQMSQLVEKFPSPPESKDANDIIKLEPGSQQAIDSTTLVDAPLKETQATVAVDQERMNVDDQLSLDTNFAYDVNGFIENENDLDDFSFANDDCFHLENENKYKTLNALEVTSNTLKLDKSHVKLNDEYTYPHRPNIPVPIVKMALKTLLTLPASKASPGSNNNSESARLESESLSNDSKDVKMEDNTPKSDSVSTSDKIQNLEPSSSTSPPETSELNSQLSSSSDSKSVSESQQQQQQTTKLLGENGDSNQNKLVEPLSSTTTVTEPTTSATANPASTTTITSSSLSSSSAANIEVSKSDNNPTDVSKDQSSVISSSTSPTIMVPTTTTPSSNQEVKSSSVNNINVSKSNSTSLNSANTTTNSDIQLNGGVSVSSSTPLATAAPLLVNNNYSTHNSISNASSITKTATTTTTTNQQQLASNSNTTSTSTFNTKLSTTTTTTQPQSPSLSTANNSVISSAQFYSPINKTPTLLTNGPTTAYNNINSMNNNSTSNSNTNNLNYTNSSSSSSCSNTTAPIVNGLMSKKENCQTNHIQNTEMSNNNSEKLMKSLQNNNNQPLSVLSSTIATVQTLNSNLIVNSNTSSLFKSTSTTLPTSSTSAIAPIIQSNIATSTTTASNTVDTSSPKLNNTNLSSHQMNDNTNIHNSIISNHIPKKTVEAVISLNTTNVSSTTTNENLPILSVESNANTTSDNNKNTNVKPMEVT